MGMFAIQNAADYREALRQIEELMDAEENSPEGDRLDAFVTLVEAYERKNYPLQDN